MPIDIVYLWVDGNDSVWRTKRQHAANSDSYLNRKLRATYGNVEGRFRDNDELKFSLRALELFFPQHGHIYIVTDAQVPLWLKPSNRLTIIDHRSLIPTNALPTFDSGHIESYIHRIPNLSERYFYLNDDMFFGAPVKPEDWFYDGGFYVAWSDEESVVGDCLLQEGQVLANASRVSKQWLSEKALRNKIIPISNLKPNALADQFERLMDPDYRHTPRTFAHAPRPMLKSVLFELEDEAKALFEKVRSTKFRSWNTPPIISDFVHRWALAHKVAAIKEYSHVYISTGDFNAGKQIECLRRSTEPDARFAGTAARVDFFCINDTTDDADYFDPRLIAIRLGLKRLFPRASQYECESNEERPEEIFANRLTNSHSFYLKTA